MNSRISMHIVINLNYIIDIREKGIQELKYKNPLYLIWYIFQSIDGNYEELV